MITVDFHVLEVGQGSMNFVEIYDEDVLVTTFLIDAGKGSSATGKKGSDTGSEASVRYVIERLQSMQKPSIAALVLSHSDADHTKLLPRILDAFYEAKATQPRKSRLMIDGIYYSGDTRLYRLGRLKPNLLKRAQEYLNTDKKYLIGVKRFNFNFTCITHADPERWEVAWPRKNRKTVDDVGESVRLMMLAANSTDDPSLTGEYDPKKPGAGDANTLSLVCVVQILTVDDEGDPTDPIHIIASGDATGDTLAQCNEAFATKLASMKTFHLTAPHHGSETTTMAVAPAPKKKKPSFAAAGKDDVHAQGKGSRDDPDPAAVTNLQQFITNTNPRTLSASSGQGSKSQGNKYHHPSGNVLVRFVNALDRSGETGPGVEEGRHFFVAYYFQLESPIFQVVLAKKKTPWPAAEKWATLQTDLAIYTTQYILPNSAKIENSQHLALLYGKGGNLRKEVEATPQVAPLGMNFLFRATTDGDTDTYFIDHLEILRAAALGEPMPEPVPVSELGSFQQSRLTAATRVQPRRPAMRTEIRSLREIG